MSDDQALWDCVIAGGGAAGLSAALVLGRARRRVLLVDGGRQSNLPAHGIGGLLGNDTRPPADFYATARHELAAYPTVQLRDGEVTSATRANTAFVLELPEGTKEATRRLLLATGMEYRYPQLPGIAPLWGRTVFHCPFCHGWEVRDQPLAVLGAPPESIHRALLLRAWSDDVTLLTDGSELDRDQRTQLAAAGVSIDGRAVAALKGRDDLLEAVVFTDGSQRRLSGLLVPVTLHQRGDLPAQLGLSLAEPGPLSAETVNVDGRYLTSVPGVYGAGDLVVQMPTVANAIMSGSVAAAAIVGSLTGAAPEPTARA